MGLRTPTTTRWWIFRARRSKRQAARLRAQATGTDWAKVTSAVTAATAIAAVIFTGLSLQATRDQNQLAQAGQITDRFSAAVTNLGSSTQTIRIGGIFALQRIMQDSPRDQPAVIQVLAAFVREQAPSEGQSASKAQASPAIDVQTALTVLGNRNATQDAGTIIDLSNTDLANADLDAAHFESADLNFANLSGAQLAGADLMGAQLLNANLTGANLYNSNLAGADLVRARLSDSILYHTDLAHSVLFGTSGLATDKYFYQVDVEGADIGGTAMCKGLTPVEPSLGYTCEPGY